MIPLTTDRKGQIAIAKVQIEAAKKGAMVLLPTTPERYDLVLDWQGKFYRAQVKYADCKTAHAQGSVYVDLRRRKRVYTKDEIDVLLVYVACVDKLCWFGPEVFHEKCAVCLRVQPTINGQKRGCRMVEEFIW
jgi:hypothetical protein